jgi:hypothetical protein
MVGKKGCFSGNFRDSTQPQQVPTHPNPIQLPVPDYHLTDILRAPKGKQQTLKAP